MSLRAAASDAAPISAWAWLRVSSISAGFIAAPLLPRHRGFCIAPKSGAGPAGTGSAQGRTQPRDATKHRVFVRQARHGVELDPACAEHLGRAEEPIALGGKCITHVKMQVGLLL